MRMLIKASMPVEVGNRAAADGTLGTTIQSILEEQKPEAVYFTSEGGKRTAHIFVNLKELSDIPAICEPWFLAFNASIDITPAMSPQDLAAGGPGIERAAKKYGSPHKSAR